ncbi:hypothetical protein [Marinobacter adhaerens]|uniref:hypothetical protein n=1 Tax=Marinobacter adhaerens TaxID=1033846 RepID=UPI003F6E8A22
MSDFTLTDSQCNWFDARVALRDDPVVLSPDDDLWHGYCGETPNLNNMQSLWLSKDKEYANTYASFGNNSGGGLLHVRPKIEITIPLTKIGLVDFIKEFDKNWGVNHDHFSRCLHSWATQKSVIGIIDKVGDIVLFRAAELLVVVTEK